MRVIELVPLDNVEGTAVDALLDRAFGPDRHARTAYKVRGAARPIAALSFCAMEGGALIGSIQCWPVLFTGEAGERMTLVMIGPVAVEPDRQQGGIGRLLMEHALAAAEAEGFAESLMLIGDPEYYGRFFGFSASRTTGWSLPGPVERHRLLARGASIPDRPGTLSAIEPARA